ncbi:hypothetical protein KDW_59210 [Dictyobacter vulcani]|uniref:HTH cro/C1-type domain-containing protein n=1 Tax=Dictyobacter vulcani TaxID=2607529 RepID=A0A5J4L0C8_9CHLR|nr:helix-turn-helix domain-containing protein [Dictyobacter vulcani]GER91759.1 hypothetical protein KDW_59210 [Dictyobacter vulcani]
MGRKDNPIKVGNEQEQVVGAFLREQRQLQNVTLTQMAAKTGYSKTYLSAIENGNIRASHNVIKEYTRHLNVATEQLPGSLAVPAEVEDELQERPWNVPFQRNPFFVGRSQTLEQLHNRLFGSRKLSHVVAITGLGGIGKTQFVTEYAYAYRAQYQGVFWIRGDSSEVMSADFTSLPFTTGLLTEGGQTADSTSNNTGHFTKKWFRQHPTCLLIIDNLDDVQDLATLARLITQLGETRVLITSRLQILTQIARSLSWTT